ncbi:MAG TPA: NAD-dependent epimerase/dehydratase family protein, partial [Phycisphaerales bacterium]|nr:NAD-dependent epimerase/dehydratase family protein [Phycisphaerales bacterium]
LMEDDVRDSAAVRRALRGVDAVYHFAAKVGVGQSMYQPTEYTDVNTLGTTVLLQELAAKPVQRLIVASSMSIYGEGRARDAQGRIVDSALRTLPRLQAGQWEPVGADGSELAPLATPEEKPPCLASVYALTKYDQERLCLMFGDAYRIPTVALRFFNAYGPRQALSNPYTGVLAIFACRLLNGNPPLIYEDGHQRRDFVSVHDIARACVLALTAPDAPGRALNIGSGESRTVRDVAAELGSALGRQVSPTVTGRYRAGDIRHCFADITLARQVLGYRPEVSLAAGLAELGAWLQDQVAVDGVERAAAELSSRGLTV